MAKGSKGCIIVPYRDRAEHLAKFIPHYRDVLPIYIIEQADNKPFNRAKLLNVGFLEAGKDYDYAVYHDVDMLSVEFGNYSWLWHNAVHLASQCSQFGYQLPYEEYFGGVTYIPTPIMQHVNGYSNNFWGWGGEDDHLLKRLTAMDMSPCRVDNIYECLDHTRNIGGTDYANNLKRLRQPDDPTDGLTSCQYNLLSTEQLDGYTLIKAEL